VTECVFLQDKIESMIPHSAKSKSDKNTSNNLFPQSITLLNNGQPRLGGMPCHRQPLHRLKVEECLDQEPGANSPISEASVCRFLPSNPLNIPPLA